MNIAVIKKDGSIEDYNPQKITKVVIAAGLYPDQANILSTNITNWLKEKNLSKVTSIQIKNQVIEELKKINQYAAGLFTWYEKTKDHPNPSTY